MESEAVKTSAEFALNESRRSRDAREYIGHEPVTAISPIRGENPQRRDSLAERGEFELPVPTCEQLDVAPG